MKQHLPLLPVLLGNQPDLSSPFFRLCFPGDLSTAAFNTSAHPPKPNKKKIPALKFQNLKISRPLQGGFLPREKGNDAAHLSPFQLSSAAAPSPPALQLNKVKSLETQPDFQELHPEALQALLSLPKAFIY